MYISLALPFKATVKNLYISFFTKLNVHKIFRFCRIHVYSCCVSTNKGDTCLCGCVALKLVCINQFKEAIKREAINKNKVFLAHSLCTDNAGHSLDVSLIRST